MHWIRSRFAVDVDRGLGRITLATVAVVTLLTATFVVATSGAPAGAGAGGPSDAGVQPTEEDLGGQPNDCAAVGSAATYELRVENPQNGTFNASAPAGVSFDLTVSSNDKLLGFDVNGPVVVYDVVIKGGADSTHYDYLGSSVGPATADTSLHAPTRGNGNNLHNISHVSFCYEEAVALTGTVLVDTNADGELVVDGAEAGRVVRAYSGTSPVASATSDANGDYTLLVSPTAGSLVICEDVRDGYVQIDRDPSIYSSSSVCSAISTAEPEGHSVSVAGSGIEGLDFDNALEICGQVLAATGGIFVANFELFGDDATPCQQKAGDLVIDGDTVELPIVGPATGSVAGIGVVEKSFADPDDFVGLTFSRLDDGTFVELQWCGLRAKGPGDGNQFDAYVPAGQYPDMTGVNYGGAEPDVSCKVYEEERVDGTQITVVYFNDDPYWR